MSKNEKQLEEEIRKDFEEALPILLKHPFCRIEIERTRLKSKTEVIPKMRIERS